MAEEEQLYDLIIPPGVPRKMIYDVVEKFDVEVVQRQERLAFANMEGDARDLLAFRGRKEVVEEVQDYLSLTREAYSTISIIASEAFMDSLPADLQDVVKKGVELFCKEQGRINSEQEAANLAYLKEKGMKVNELTPEQRALFVEATKDVREKHARREGRQELYEQVLALLK
mgnify:CR=1 FL=1